MKTIITCCVVLAALIANAQFTYHHGFSLGYLGDDGGGSVETDPLGNLIVAGSFETSLDVDPGSGFTTLISGANGNFLAKYTSAGSLVWAAEGIGGNIALDDAGDIYVTAAFTGTKDFDPSPGTTNLTASDDVAIYLAHYNNAGEYQWAVEVGATNSTVSVTSIAVENGSIVICGYFADTLTIGTTTLISTASQHAFIVKMDDTGSPLWTHSFGGDNFSLTYGFEVEIDDGKVYLAGTLNDENIDVDPGSNTTLLSTNGSSDIYIIKYESNGDLEWAFNVGGSTGENAGDFTIDSDGDLLVGGFSNSDKIDVDPGSDSTFLYEEPGINAGQDIIVVKYTIDGDYVWGFRFGQDGSDVVHGIAVDERDNIFITGSFGHDSVDFDPGSGTFYLHSTPIIQGTTNLNSAAYIAHYDGANQGAFMSAYAIGGSQPNASLGVALAGGKVWFTGSFSQDTVDLDPGTGTDNKVNAGENDFFLAGYSYPHPLGIKTPEVHQLKIYPTLTSHSVTIDSEARFSKADVQVKNTEGRVIFSEKVTQFPVSLSVQNLPAGVYFVSCLANGKFYSAKFVKE